MLPTMAGESAHKDHEASEKDDRTYQAMSATPAVPPSLSGGSISPGDCGGAWAEQGQSGSALWFKLLTERWLGQIGRACAPSGPRGPF